MPDLTPTETLQPSLLDRLTDLEPTSNMESRDKRVLTVRRLREAVLRDLSWIFNSGNLDNSGLLDDYPNVQDSVINFGIRDLTGLTEGSIDAAQLERSVREAIRRFEPRILSDTVNVKITFAGDDGTMPGNQVSFEIEGELWAQPLPVHLFLQTEVDLESGTFKVEQVNR